ncbi:MAG: MATE family efflux transporter [Fuerstiella sp.]|nr:MATE family efflux transporter [Fuerstiella sp.]
MSDSSITTCRKDGALKTHQILHGHLGQRILILALPTLLQQLLTFCVALFDTWLSGRIDAAATAAIGMAAYIGWLAGLVVSTICIGTTAIVARHLGAGEPEQANRVMHTALIVGQLVSLGMSAFLYVMAPVFVMAFALEGPTAVVGLNYLRMDAIGHVLSGIVFVGAAALRGSGDMARPMLVLGTINVLNIILSCCFVYGIGPESPISAATDWLPAFGVYGIAAGTVGARLAGGLMMACVLLSGSGALRFRPGLMRPDSQIIRRLVSLGGYAAADNLINWLGQFSFLIIIRNVTGMPFSADVIFAAHMVGLQVEAITYLPAIAWGQSAAAITGQCLGARKIRRAFRAGIVATLQCCVLGVIVTVVFFWGAETIYLAMHSDPQITSVGAEPFRAMALFQIPLIVFLVLKFALHGAGDTQWPMIATITGTICLRLPLAWFLGVHLGMGLIGAWTGMFVDVTLRAALLLWRYLGRSWLRKRV